MIRDGVVAEEEEAGDDREHLGVFADWGALAAAFFGGHPPGSDAGDAAFVGDWQASQQGLQAERGEGARIVPGAVHRSRTDSRETGAERGGDLQVHAGVTDLSGDQVRGGGPVPGGAMVPSTGRCGRPGSGAGPTRNRRRRG